MRIVFTAAARNDLCTIGDYIASEAPSRADGVVQALIDRCLSLAEMPLRYPLVPRYGASGVRRAVHGSYLIFYRVNAETVDIVHVLHGAMDYESMLFPDRGS